MTIAFEPTPPQLHQLAAQSRLATERADRRREQTRELVRASQHCCAQSRRVISNRRRALTVDPAVRDEALPVVPKPRATTNRPALAAPGWGPAAVAGVDGGRGGTAAP